MELMIYKKGLISTKQFFKEEGWGKDQYKASIKIENLTFNWLLRSYYLTRYSFLFSMNSLYL